MKNKLYDFFDEYFKWLKGKGINSIQLVSLTDGQKGMMTSAFIRDTRKHWKITRKQKELIKELREDG